MSPEICFCFIFVLNHHLFPCSGSTSSDFTRRHRVTHGATSHAIRVRAFAGKTSKISVRQDVDGRRAPREKPIHCSIIRARGFPGPPVTPANIPERKPRQRETHQPDN
jgi:hypothetical protein